MASTSGPEGALQRGPARLRYRIRGQGPTILVPGSSVFYPRTLSRSLDSRCRLVFIDLPHFAEHTAPAGPPSLASYLADIEAMRVHLGLEECVLLGHSHHGNLAMEYALEYPGAVTGLVLVGSPPCDVPTILAAGDRYWQEHADAGRRAILEARLQQLDESRLARLPVEKAFVARYVSDGPLYWFDPDYDATWLWQGVPVDRNALTAFKTFFRDQDFAACAAQLDMPVLAIAGEYDYVVPHVLWEACSTPFPDLVLHRFDRSGHTPQLEEPQRFEQVLLSWLGSLSADPGGKYPQRQ